MDFSFEIAIEGFLVGISLIIPIGVQNAYILRQGALGKHPYVAAFVCSLCDTLLIVIGALGLGAVITTYASLRRIAMVGGILFLGYYGTKSFIRAAKSDVHQKISASSSDSSTPKMVVMSAIAFSLLNPHAILDTTVLIGSIAAQRAIFAERISFTLGATIASWVWFFSLSFFASLLRPILQKPLAVRILDGIVGVLMFAVIILLIHVELQFTNG